MVLTIAMESRGADSARGPIHRAKPTHPSLVDRDHLVADLYNMVNVPQSVWIDEEGTIVRPAEISGAAITLNFAKVKKTRAIYLDAIRDWVAKGSESEFAFSEAEAREHLRAYTPEIAEAHACFHLGQHLWNRGDPTEGARFLKRAVKLNPESWNFFRQMKNLEHILGSGGFDFLRRARQMKKAGNTYYPLPDMRTMQELGD